MTDPMTAAARIAQLEVQVDWLRQLVDHLYGELGVAAPAYRPPVPKVDDEISRAIDAGRMITATKLYRERTGVGLMEAKDAVEALARGR